MAKSKKNKHKANRKRTQKYTGPIPVQFAKHLKDIIRVKSTGMEEYNYLVEEKYRTNATTTYIKTRKNTPLYEIYKDDDKCFYIAQQVVSVTWYKYHKIIYKMSQSILDYIDNTFCIPDDYDEILNNLTLDEIDKFEDDGKLPSALEKIVVYDPATNLFVSKEYPDVMIGNMYDILEASEYIMANKSDKVEEAMEFKLINKA